MKTIWKFTLLPQSQIELQIPEGFEALSVQTQNGVPQLWCLVDPEAEPHWAVFYIYGTGHDVTARGPIKFIGTFQLPDEGLVFHVFQAVLK